MKTTPYNFITLSFIISILSACQQHLHTPKTPRDWQQYLYTLTPRQSSIATVQQRCQQEFHTPCHQHIFASIDLNNGPALYDGVDLKAQGYHSMVYTPLSPQHKQNSIAHRTVVLWFFDVDGRLQQIMIQNQKAP